MNRVLVTGAAGFVGRSLCAGLLQQGHGVCAALRDCTRVALEGVEPIAVGTIDATTDWRYALAGCNAVVHLAARVHVMCDKAMDPLSEFRVVNVEGTLHLAQQAAEAGVRRFLYLSSIKVNGEHTLQGQPFTEHDVPAPLDPYGISKYEAEEGLRMIAQQTGLEVVIIRPPLVYGPGVKANFLRLMRWLHRGMPLPLGSIHNKRSLVALDNLVDLLTRCLDHPEAAGQTFLVSDGDDLSTPELLQKLAGALGCRAPLLPVPPALLRFGGRLLGRSAEVERLLSSLQVDISSTCETLGWTPPVTVEEGLRKTAEWFKGHG